jgi:hypothetical protein
VAARTTGIFGDVFWGEGPPETVIQYTQTITDKNSVRWRASVYLFDRYIFGKSFGFAPLALIFISVWPWLA